MDVRKWLQQTAEYGYNSVAGGLGIAGAGVGYVTELVGNLRLFGSTTTSSTDEKFDERHYFLVPDTRSEDGYSLVVTRCPMFELHTLLQSTIADEQRRMFRLASSAVLDVFDTAMRSTREANKAGLGPEDLRYLELLKSFGSICYPQRSP